jgi:hypothetical protein
MRAGAESARGAPQGDANVVTAGAVASVIRDARAFHVFSGSKKGRVYARLKKSGSRIRPAVVSAYRSCPQTERVGRAGRDHGSAQARFEHEHEAHLRDMQSEATCMGIH